jgi:hypothetical protein
MRVPCHPMGALVFLIVSQGPDDGSREATFLLLSYSNIRSLYRSYIYIRKGRVQVCLWFCELLKCLHTTLHFYALFIEEPLWYDAYLQQMQ